MTVEIPESIVTRACDMLDERGSTDSVREMLTTILALPEVRQAIYEDVRHELDERLKSMGVTGYSMEF